MCTNLSEGKDVLKEGNIDTDRHAEVIQGAKEVGARCRVDTKIDGRGCMWIHLGTHFARFVLEREAAKRLEAMCLKWKGDPSPAFQS